MKQKSRYNVRLAERKGVTVRQAGRDDLALLFQMYAETSVRDGFVIRDEAYYLELWDVFMRRWIGRAAACRGGWRGGGWRWSSSALPGRRII